MKTLGGVGQLIEIEPESKATIKAQALCEIELPFKYEYNGISITIEKTTFEGDVLGVYAIAEKDGKKYTDWHYFKNPPILVPDGTFETVKETIDGEIYEKQLHNFIEDPEEALKTIVGQVVEGVKWQR